MTFIAFESFYVCTSLTSVTIPDSVTSIGDSVFSGCTSLKSVTFPNSVAFIGFDAFGGCTSLTRIAIPNNVTEIGIGAFAYCSSLTSVTIPNSVTSIGIGAFYFCTSLTSITIPDSVTSIGDSGFYVCTNLASVIMGNGVTSIGVEAFFFCTSLTRVTIPNSLTSIGDSGFYGCNGLKDITLPDSLMSIGASAFGACTSLTRIAIPKSVTSIGFGPFVGCTSLSAINVITLNPAYVSVEGVLFDRLKSTVIAYPAGRIGAYVIPDSVTSIGHRAFSGCKSLTSVTIPNSVTAIGGSALGDCPTLTSVYFDGTPAFDYGNFFDGSPFVTVFHRAGAAGWGSSFGGRPTAVWTPLPSYAEWAASSGLAVNYPSSSGENDDPDGDGINNHDEWLSGTDPTQKASVLVLELVPRPMDLSADDQKPVPSNKRTIYFRSVPGRYYGIQSTGKLPGDWQFQAVRIAPTEASQTRFLLDQPTTNAFFRVLALP